MMRIGFDASVISGRFTGVEYYALRLLENLRALGGEVEIVPFSNRPVPRVPDAVVVPSPLPRALWRQTVLPGAIRQHDLSSFHSPVTSFPLPVHLPVVATVHDIAYMLLPACYSRTSRAYQRLWLERATARAAAVVCVSAATRAAVLRVLPGTAARLETIHNGAVAIMPPPDDASLDCRERIEDLQVRPPFALIVGRIEKRKNPVRAFQAFMSATAEPPLNQLTLVYAGAPGNAMEELRAAVEAIPEAARRVRLCAYLEEHDLTCLYAAADVLLYLSLDEGFGHPPLEALAQGIPVVAADIPVLREVIGDAAVFANPADVDAMVAAIRQILTDRHLRKLLIAHGAQRLRAFSWKNTARRVLALHQEVVAAAAG